MKKLLLSLFVCSTASFSFAQELTPEVISTAGTSMTDGTTVLDFTIGEPVTATFDNGTNIATQGFHQNDMLITSLDELVSNDFTVYPNPTVDVVNIQFAKPNEMNVIELFSVEGKLLSSQSVNSSTISQVNMTTYSSGTYLLKVRNTVAKDFTFRVVKTK